MTHPIINSHVLTTLYHIFNDLSSGGSNWEINFFKEEIVLDFSLFLCYNKLYKFLYLLIYSFFIYLFILLLFILYEVIMSFKLKNNWETWHDVSWTSFEIKSSILGILRKNLYSEGYLVRGEYHFITNKGKHYSPSISIFKKQFGKPAILRLIVSVNGEENSILLEQDLGVPVIEVNSQEEVFLLLEKIKQTI